MKNLWILQKHSIKNTIELRSDQGQKAMVHNMKYVMKRHPNSIFIEIGCLIYYKNTTGKDEINDCRIQSVCCKRHYEY